ncbi:hypothetical protein F4V43_00515 [Paenibacillus spiritus]|uniref:Uncharacterized protein n=1 Tax=Paenibacillus spiritus TaxID=2496557 RepID=A0A5J5GM08_9BACL|nr:hypothetical protein [Paenibacillus spiritus]KAA9008648.1 hypothetical protein F4V43_00515 [Paenibacillus spiritus]
MIALPDPDNLERLVLKRLLTLMRFRNAYPAFGGEIEIAGGETPETLEIVRRQGDAAAVLRADLAAHTFTVTYRDEATGEMKELAGV